MPKLKVSENHRYLVTSEGKPFFYLADTAWELFHRLNREEATRYLEDRARKGYTVIQAVALAELDGFNDPNAYGNKANSLGLYVGFLPTWGDKWNKKWGAGPEIFTAQNGVAYGEWLGRRYKDSGIIWILGGDRPVETAAHVDIQRGMAKGLRAGDGGAHLMTFHPTGGAGSAQSFHTENWLDFNMRQNGHMAEYTGRYDKTAIDFDRMPVKPVLDGEPIYEDHPVNFKAAEFGHSVSSDVRRPLYWGLFDGAFGHTYGHHSVWQMWSPGKNPVNNPLMPWSSAIEQPGAGQMQFARKLLESRPFLTRIPDDSILVTDRVATSVPGTGRYRFKATRDQAGTYAMIYAPVGRKFSVHMDKIQGVIPAPTRPAAHTKPCVRALSVMGNQREMTPAMFG